MLEFKVNGKAMSFDGDTEMPLLWYLREQAGLTGTKYGCGVAQCGTCTVHFNGRATRSCVLPMSAVNGADIKTIESLAEGDQLHPVQQAWVELDVAQCGYCQAGQIMAVADLLERISNPTDEDIDSNLTNICRCGTYVRIRKAIHRAAEIKSAG